MRVMVVDDASGLGQTAQRALRSAGIKATVAASLDDLPPLFETGGAPDVLVLSVDTHVSAQNVLACIGRIGFSGQLVVLMDDGGDERVGPLKQIPRARCVVRPHSASVLGHILERAVVGSLRPPGSEARPSQYHGIVGRSPRMQELFTRIEKVATTDANVCISGESGTGKELIARAIHYASLRRNGPLITLDCTTVPEGLMESQLFGHVKGAFTSAVERREGVFSLADSGTLFIDELGEMSLSLQAKLLRVIQSRDFIMVGGTKPIRTDVRLITATNKDLRNDVDAGKFREDLYYRVAVIMLEVPPLRERVDDIPLLVGHFLKKFSARYRKRLASVEPVALARMLGMPWPGNVRQLENFLEQAVVLAEGTTLTERDLFGSDVSATLTPASFPDGYEPGLLLREVERFHILRTLTKAQGNRTETARLLGISLRCLQYKLKEYAQKALAP